MLLLFSVRVLPLLLLLLIVSIRMIIGDGFTRSIGNTIAINMCMAIVMVMVAAMIVVTVVTAANPFLNEVCLLA